MKGLLAIWRHCRQSKAATAPAYSANICSGLRCESLEERALLSASPLWIDADPSAADGILVQIREDMTASWTANGARPLSRLTPDLLRIELPDGADIESQLANWRAHADVLYAEPDYVVQLAATPNDPSFDSLWGLNNLGQTGGTLDADIDAAEAWDITTGSGQRIVAVIDTGVDYLHEDLADNIWTNPGEVPGDGVDNDSNGFIDDVHGYDFANNDGDPLDDHNHGTHVAGTIGAVGNNGIGVAGVNWNVQIMAVKFLQGDGSGAISDAIEALDYAVENGASISNNSWGFNGGSSQALHNAVAAAQSQGHIFVAAAGNGNFAGVGLNNDVAPFWPSNIDLDNVVAVAALDDEDQRAVFSNFGATTVDVGAPGVGILSTTIGDTYSTFNGTSMAAPHVSGAIALLWDAHPTWSYQQVINQLFNSVDPVNALSGITTTGGRINALNTFADDVTEPYIVNSAPAGEVATLFNHVRITFSEMIDAASFSTADVVSFTGPGGSVAVSDVLPVANSLGRQFDVTFSQQSEIGEFELIIGSEISDISANLLDQDGDGVGGEAIDDHYTHAVTLLPFVGRYDFGSTQSAVAQGFTRVSPFTGYTPSSGFGWVGGAGIDAVRAGGDALTSDLVYGPNLTFVADVPSGVYDITLTTGDFGPYEHDLMDLLLEGFAADSITTEAGEVKTLHYSNVAVGDGQLTLDLIDQGGVDPNVVINGLEVLWAGPDTVSPFVVAHNASGVSPSTVDRLALTFSEHLAPGAFTIDDIVELVGPDGPIAASSVTEVSPSQFDVNFPAQVTVGNYRLTVGAEIADREGNLIDQDGDGIGGESSDDQYTALFQLDPFSRRFDFGIPTSPVAAAYTRVTPADVYTAAAGFGWQGSGGAAVDRNAPDPLSSDLVYSNELVFEADVPDGVYAVTLTIGDAGPHTHESMQVNLEGVDRDVITSSAGEVHTRIYDDVSVADGRLSLRLTDLGGIDPNVVLNGLELVLLGPDVAGPQVTATDPVDEVSGSATRARLSFSEFIDAASFTIDDVMIAGPSGPVAVASVAQVSPAEFEIVFDEQTALGGYQITVGPDVIDAAGNAMDQDGDGVNGEALEDRFTLDFNIVPLAQRFDFGTTGSPVAADHTQVTNFSAYSPANGFGYLAGNVQSIDRFVGAAETRDLNYASSFTFAVDGQDGVYDVEISIGDAGPYGHDEMAVYLEGVQIDAVTTLAGEVQTLIYSNIAVNDGQLTLRMDNLGGIDPNVVINALAVTRLGGDGSSPRVIAASPNGEVAAPVDRIVVDFSKPIDASTFTPLDVLSLTGPGGPITPSSVNGLSATRFEVVFPAQFSEGNYAFELGPDIRDLDGRLMDQDQDGVSGEALEDRFASSFSIAPVTAKFDFGTSFSPVAGGYDQVLTTTGYSGILGYGWQSTGLLPVDRGGDPLAGDLVYAQALTFAVDLPDGAYEVILTVGDLGPYAHEAMDVFAEGVHIDSISTAAGEVTTRTYQGVAVVDGQFNLSMVDAGGSDPNVVLNGLELRAVRASATRVVRADPIAATSGAVDRVRFVFNLPIDPATFTVADVVELNGPTGPIVATGVEQVSANVFDVVFDSQQVPGTYSLTIGPDIAATSGGTLDQDGDGAAGEVPDDQFGATFEVSPFTARFDFGSFGSPAEAGYLHVLPGESYSAVVGYGYESGLVAAVDRFSGSNLERDIHYGADFTFRVDAPEGLYTVVLTMGDRGPYAHESMGVFLGGQQIDTVSTAPGEVATFTYNDVAVAGGKFELRLLDLSGPDVNAVLAGLELSAQPAAPGALASTHAATDAATDAAIAALSWPLLDHSPLQLKDSALHNRELGRLEIAAVRARDHAWHGVFSTSSHATYAMRTRLADNLPSHREKVSEFFTDEWLTLWDEDDRVSLERLNERDGWAGT